VTKPVSAAAIADALEERVTSYPRASGIMTDADLLRAAVETIRRQADAYEALRMLGEARKREGYVPIFIPPHEDPADDSQSLTNAVASIADRIAGNDPGIPEGST
jgi:hypothetical protein